MKAAADRPTRIAADLLDSAAAEGQRQNRSAKAQLDHWARIGRAVSDRTSVGWLRVQGAFTGTVDMATLSAEEAVIFGAEVEVGVQERLHQIDLGASLARSGVRVVGLDASGQLIQRLPDGSVDTLASP